MHGKRFVRLVFLQIELDDNFLHFNFALWQELKASRKITVQIATHVAGTVGCVESRTQHTKEDVRESTEEERLSPPPSPSMAVDLRSLKNPDKIVPRVHFSSLSAKEESETQDPLTDLMAMASLASSMVRSSVPLLLFFFFKKKKIELSQLR